MRRRRERGRAGGDGYAANVEVVRAATGKTELHDGETVEGRQIHLEPAIEVGNIFKLGTRYSEPLGATYLDETGAELQSGWAPTGSGRRGSRRPRSSSTPTSTASPGRARWRRSTWTWWGSASRGRPSTSAAERMFDDAHRAVGSTRSTTIAMRPGEKFADAELLGCPLRLTVGRRTLESGEIEVQVRRGRVQAPGIPLEESSRAGLVRAVDELWRSLP